MTLGPMYIIPFPLIMKHRIMGYPVLGGSEVFCTRGRDKDCDGTWALKEMTCDLILGPQMHDPIMTVYYDG